MFVKPLCLLFCGLLSWSAQAQIYKSVDARGRTLYSDAPPPSAPASTVKMIAPPVAIQAPADWEARAYDSPRRMPMPEAVPRTNEYAASAAASRACTAARAKLRELERIEGRRAYRIDAQGERVFISDEERGMADRDARQAIATYCQ